MSQQHSVCVGMQIDLDGARRYPVHLQERENANSA